ncbi:MAG: hypothetical protein WKI04_18410, partial [Ferruginibacter sp.]
TDKSNTLPQRVQPKNLPQIIALDQLVFGASRAQFINALVKEYPGKCWMLNRNSSLTGFMLGRDGNNYQQIGPVVARDTVDAKSLISAALNDLANQPVVVDVLADKTGLVDWLQAIGFIQQRQFTRMYKNENIQSDSDKQYLVAGPEFG